LTQQLIFQTHLGLTYQHQHQLRRLLEILEEIWQQTTQKTQMPTI